MSSELAQLSQRIRQCQLCALSLPHGVRPVLQVQANAKLLIIGQAPGRKVHESGVPFDDASGDRLRNWLDLPRSIFYDANHVAIMPMGFCYPGTGKNGDLPPRQECAPCWHKPILNCLGEIKLTILLGQYAQQYYLLHKKKSVTQVVADWQQYGPTILPLPHPSPRNNIWIKRNPWFETHLLPALKNRVKQIFEN